MVYFGVKANQQIAMNLYDFIVEAKILLTDGLKINQINQPIPVSIFAICCDAPAKSFLTKTKGHTGKRYWRMTIHMVETQKPTVNVWKRRKPFSTSRRTLIEIKNEDSS